jgi:hypothetical protein
VTCRQARLHFPQPLHDLDYNLATGHCLRGY